MSDIEKNTTHVANVRSGEIKELFPAAADEALNFLRAEELPGSAVEINEKALVRKIDWMVNAGSSLLLELPGLDY